MQQSKLDFKVASNSSLLLAGDGFVNLEPVERLLKVNATLLVFCAWTRRR